MFLGLCGPIQEPTASLTPIFPLAYLEEVMKVLGAGMQGAQGEARMVLDVERGLVEMRGEGKVLELKYGELMLLAKFKGKKTEERKGEIRSNGLPGRAGVLKHPIANPSTDLKASTPLPQGTEAALTEATSTLKPEYVEPKSTLPSLPKPVLKPVQPEVRQVQPEAKTLLRPQIQGLKPDIRPPQAEIRPHPPIISKPDLRVSQAEPKPSVLPPQLEPIPTPKIPPPEAAPKGKKPSAIEVLAALRNQVRDQRRVQPSPAPKEPEKPATTTPPSLAQAVKDRLLKLDRLQDFCEEFFEVKGLQLGEMSSRQGKLKVCRIEVEGRSVAEATGDTWETARGKAAWEAVCQFDKGLAEEWLAGHQGALTDNGNASSL